MGVVKNLMVRIGADVRGVVGGMKTAYQSTRQATSQIKAATADMKRSVKDSFSGSRMSIREYKETIAGVKASQNAAMQNAERLQEKLSHLQSVYDSLADATAGLDLSTPLTTQIKEAEESWHGFLNEAQKVKDTLKKELDSGGNKDNSEKITNLRQQLQSLREKAGEAELELRNLKAVAAAIGSENIGFASTSGMGSLRSDMEKTQRELEISQIKAGELGQRLKALSVPQMIKSELKSIGAAAASAARTGVAQLGSRLKSLAGSAVRGIVTLPLQLLGIGRSAAAGSTSLEKMVRSIRNIGAVSLGLRVVGGIFRGIFGELQGIISSYISQNDELSATISNMKAQLGQALAPAINAVISVMRRLMPVIQTIASVINGIFTTLFGKVKTTTSGVKSSAAAAKTAASTAVAAAKQLDLYSFDQINRQSDDPQDSGADDAGVDGFDPESLFDLTPPKWLDSVLDWINQMKAAFKAGDWEGLGRIFGEGINKAVDAINAVDIGKKVGTFVNNLFTTLNSALATIDFFNIGKKVGEFVTSGFQAVNWNTVGETIGRVITALPSVAVGFIQNTDWGLIARSISNALKSAMDTVSEWLRSTDWRSVGSALADALRGIDWHGLLSSLGSVLWEAFKAGVEMLVGFIKSLTPEMVLGAIKAAVVAIAAKIVLTEIIVALTGALATVVGTIVATIAGWPVTIIAAAVVAVAAIAAWLKNGGKDVVAGFLEGIKEAVSNIGDWINEHIVQPFVDAFKNLFGIHSPSTVMHEHGVNVIQGFFEGILETLGNIGEWISTHIVTPFLKWITSLFGISDRGSILKDTGSRLINGLLDGMTEGWSSVETYLDTKIIGLDQKFTQGWLKIKDSTASTWKEIANAVSDSIKSLQASATQQVEQLRQKLASGWQGIKADAEANLVPMAQNIRTHFQTMRTEAVNSFTGMKGDIQRIWVAITAQLKSSLNECSQNFSRAHNQMKTESTKVWNEIQAVFSSNSDGIAKRMESLRSRLVTTWNNLLDSITSAMSRANIAMNNGFNDMASHAQDRLLAISDAVRNMCDIIITNVNNAMSAISQMQSQTASYGSYSSSGSSSRSSSSSSGSGKKYSVGVTTSNGGAVSYSSGGKDYTGGAGGSSMHLATGGITTGPTAALIGEAGREVVLPLERNLGYLDPLAQRIQAFIGAGQTSSTPVVFKFYVGGKKISQHVIKDINSITQTTGVCPITV